MGAEWFVLDPNCKEIAGPFRTEAAAMRRAVAVLKATKRKGLTLGPLLPIRKPLTYDGCSTLYTSMAEVPRAAFRAQRRGRMIVVPRSDGLAEVRDLP